MQVTTKNPTHEAIMEGLSNLAALYRMADGWTDAMFPFKNELTAYDPKILAQMVKVRGEAKILIKMLSKELLRNDEEAIDIMFEHLGRAISQMCKYDLGQRAEFIAKLAEIEVR